MNKYLKVIILLVLSLCLRQENVRAAESMIQIKGSDTLINVVQKLSEEYMNKNPGKHIAVTGGGSGTGVAALINRQCDIANASREMKEKEISMAEAAGVEARLIVIGLDGLSVIVNGSNKIEKLTMDEIGKIYRGEITNWKEVGGDDLAISLYGRQSNSGTFSLFRDMVLKGDYSPQMKRMNGNSQLVEAVKYDKTAIAYVGVGYVKTAGGINVLKVAIQAGGEYADPLNENDVKSGKYPIARTLNQYINGVPSGNIRDFIEFELSPEGQKIVEEEGFFPVPKKYAESNKENM